MTQHYFSETPGGEYRTREIEVVFGDASHTLLTAGSVFSPEQLDRGTRTLLDVLAAQDAEDGRRVAASETAADETSDTNLTSPILDIGCGWGPIALAAALQFPKREVWAIDVNERARELTIANAARLGLTNVRVSAPADVPETLTFGEIRSNPPIRVGKQVLHGILEHWLPRLNSGGAAYLVVAKHLGANSLQEWIESTIPDLTVDRFARSKGFHVIRAISNRDAA